MGTTTVPFEYFDSADQVDRFTTSLGGVQVLALDTEGASFHRFLDRIYLLQLSAAGKHAIIDPLPIGKPSGLGSLLESGAVQVVFHDADYDLRLLHQDYGWQVRNIFDTRVAAQLLGVKAFGLAALLEQHFGHRLDKKHQRADWSMRPLTDDMLAYAVQDTAYLVELRDVLADQLAKKERRAWADEEFRRLEGTRWPPDDPATAFLRLKGARDLNRRELARLRALVAWRDGVARRLDRSTFRVVGNDVLLIVAREAPTTREDVAKTPGVPRAIAERYGSDLAAAVVEGNAVPEADLPRFPKGPRWSRDPDLDQKVGLLKQVRDAWATKLDLDPGVLCSRERLETIARRVPRDLETLGEVKDLRRWQIDLMGEEFVKVLRPFAATPTPDDESPYRDG
jgi:ribonuclease D